MPTRIPNLLINGSDGIAVGMATKIPPHNLTEIVDATIALMRDPEIEITELTKIVTGPDFPTGGFIYGREEIKSSYLDRARHPADARPCRHRSRRTRHRRNATRSSSPRFRSRLTRPV